MSSEGAGANLLSVTMIRCSTLLLSWGGHHLLTDPWFAMHLRGLPCLRRPGLRARQLPPLDAVLVSHLHPDHYDRRAMKRLCAAPERQLFPPGSAEVLGGLPAGGQELAPWSSTRLGELEIWAVPGPHTLPGPEEINFVLLLPGWGTLFFGGDAKLDVGVLTQVRQRFGPTRLALLPVGGTRILGTRTVMSPRDAARATELLDAEQVVPIHEGGIWMSVPPLSLHMGRGRHLAQHFESRGQPVRVVILREGESGRF